MSHLTAEEQAARKDILDHFAHIQARSFKPKDALDQLVREIAFTHLNRLCAYKMMEAREVYHIEEHDIHAALHYAAALASERIVRLPVGAA